MPWARSRLASPWHSSPTSRRSSSARPTSDPNDVDSSSETVVVLIRDEDGIAWDRRGGRPGAGREGARPDGRSPRVEPRAAERAAGARPVRARRAPPRPVRGDHLPRRGVGSGSTRSRLSTSRCTTSWASSWDGPRTSSSAALAATSIRPYATIYPGIPGDRTIGELMDELARGFERALELGFRAIKMEAFFGDLVSDRELVGCIREGRRLVGDDTTLLVDFGYRWSDWRAALWTLNRLEELRPLPGRGDAPARRPRGPREARGACRDAHRRRRDGRDALRVPRVDRARPRGRPPARRQPGGWADRDGADRPARRAAPACS